MVVVVCCVSGKKKASIGKSEEDSERYSVL